MHSGNEAGSPDNPLLARLRERIGRHGPIPVDQYMQACVGDPGHGYWHRHNAIGATGDFVTAPEISQIFGELIGLWCAVGWQQLGQPATLRLVELGPGRGTLMRDALRAARAVPGFADAASIHLVEFSAALRQMQRNTLAAHAGTVSWHASLADVPPGPAIVIANEFLDALPIRQLVRGSDAWHERVVAMDAQGALKFAFGSPVQLDLGPETDAVAGSIVELRAGEEDVLHAFAARSGPVVALIIDYGPAVPCSGDTLQAVCRHAYVDPLADPGRADLTAHVRFAALAGKVHAAGLAADGPITQAEFLGRLGMVERAARLMAANPGKAAGIEAGVQRLMSPTGMGQLFKVMAVRSRELPPWPPFS